MAFLQWGRAILKHPPPWRWMRLCLLAGRTPVLEEVMATAGLSKGELEGFLSSWQKQLHPTFLKGVPCLSLVWCGFRSQPCDMKQIMATKLNSIFKVKLNQSVLRSHRGGDIFWKTDRRCLYHQPAFLLCFVRPSMQMLWVQSTTLPGPPIQQQVGLSISGVHSLWASPARRWEQPQLSASVRVQLTCWQRSGLQCPCASFIVFSIGVSKWALGINSGQPQCCRRQDLAYVRKESETQNCCHWSDLEGKVLYSLSDDGLYPFFNGLIGLLAKKCSAFEFLLHNFKFL